jgi:predicted outer membrane repeat protein
VRLLLASAFAALALAPAAHAASPVVVYSMADGPVDQSLIDGCLRGASTCTLRAAIATVTQLDDGTGITFAPPLNGGQISLTAGSLEVTTSTTITGPGSALMTIDGSAGDLDNGIIEDEAPSLTVSGLTLRDGTSSDGIFNKEGGGGIQQTAGDLTLTDVAFDSNESGGGNNGGALYADGNSTTITDGSFTQNTTSGGVQTNNGGAIQLESGTLSIDGTAFDGNIASDRGGAINGDGGAITIKNATFTNNQSGDAGGAVHMDQGPLTVTGTTFTGNSSTSNGSALATSAADTVTVGSSHFTGNRTGPSVPGGTVFAQNLVMNSSVMTGNTAIYASALAVSDEHRYTGTLQLTSTSITGNTSIGSTALVVGCDDIYLCTNVFVGGPGTITGSTIQDNNAPAGVSWPECFFTASRVTDGGGNQLDPTCTFSGYPGLHG